MINIIYNLSMIFLYVLSFVFSLFCLHGKLKITKNFKDNEDIAKKYNRYSIGMVFPDMLLTFIISVMEEGGINPNPEKEKILTMKSWSVVLGFTILIFISILGFIMWNHFKKYLKDTDFYKQQLHIYGAYVGIVVGWVKMIFTITVLGNLQVNLVTHALG